MLSLRLHVDWGDTVVHKIITGWIHAIKEISTEVLENSIKVGGILTQRSRRR